jgi:hypothetical protein
MIFVPQRTVDDGGSRNDWYLVNRGQGYCSTYYNIQESLHKKRTI